MLLWRHRSLIAALSRREIESRYRGHFGGLFWYVLQNLVLLAIYTWVFGSILGARWSTRGGGEADFAVGLFMGLITFNLFAEPASRAPQLIVSNGNFVKKIVFPLEILPVVTVLVAVFNALVAFAVLVVLAVFRGAPIAATAAWLPLIVLPVVLFALGASWFLASLGVYVRDVTQLAALSITGLMFLSPLFFSRSAIPERYRWLIDLNPLSIPLEQARGALMLNDPPDPATLILAICAGLVVAGLGLAWFQATRRGFADVL